MYNLNILAGYNAHFLKGTIEIPMLLARAKYPRPTEKELMDEMNRDDVVSFIIARHPLERLVSGYRDTIANVDYVDLDDLRRSIVAKYRGVILPKNQTIVGENLPTFKEFVMFVIDEMEMDRELDMHWAPVYTFCNPCQVSFTIIAKFETLERDFGFLIKSARIGDLVNSTVVKNGAKDGRKSSEIASSYIKTLGKEVYERIVDIYAVDFDIFGYKKKRYNEL